MKIKRFFRLMLLAVTIILSGCSTYKNQDFKHRPVAKKLFKKLDKTKSKGVMLGHQDDLAYGIGWKFERNQPLNSDVFQAAGRFPYIMGWDIGKLGHKENLDGVPFDDMKFLIKQAHEMNAINTVSWHPYFFNDSISSWDTNIKVLEKLLPNGEHHEQLKHKLDLVAAFFDSLRTPEGKRIPVIFRPWHEMNGSWFWWGENYCSNDNYKELFRFTVDYLKNEKGLNNLLIAYSPDRMFSSQEEYLKYYPGDTYVDILGVDNYYDFQDKGDGLEAVVEKLTIVVKLAKEKGKLAAFTETGYDRLEKPNWFTKELYYVLQSNNLIEDLSYFLLWRNRDLEHFYVPPKEHPLFQDFIDFTNYKNILLIEK